jgi:hypothetical protein
LFWAVPSGHGVAAASWQVELWPRSVWIVLPMRRANSAQRDACEISRIVPMVVSRQRPDNRLT